MASTDLDPTALTDQFHRMYYDEAHRTWQNTSWLATEIAKCPLDLWIYQELVTRVRPNLIIETGTYKGGNALYLASICDLLGSGSVITIDISTDADRPEHGRVTYLRGSSTSRKILRRVKEEASGAVMVILDSDHRHAHVRDELRAYSPLVTPGSYLIVEDTNINGHPAYPEFGPGPMEAVEEFLVANPGFIADPDCEKFFLTFNPRGYLRRV